MAIFGSVTGAIYPLGLIIVSTPGTSVTLDQNVPIKTAFGSSSATAPTMRINQIIFKARGGTSGSGSNVANTGNIYVCYKGGNRTAENSILADLQPGQGMVISAPQHSSPLDPSIFALDADSGGDACRVFVVVA